MKRKMSFLLLSMSIFLSCVAGAVLADALAPPVDAKQDAAQQFSECFATTTWFVTGRRLNEGESPKDTTKIPPGWTVVGGGANMQGIYIFLCR